MRHKRDIKLFKNACCLRHNLTDAEIKLWEALRMHQMDGVHFRRQHTIGNYIVDFCSPSKHLIVEVDGGQHLVQKEYDLKRTSFLESKGYKVFHFWDHEVLNDLNAVLQVIFDSINNTEKMTQNTPSCTSPVFCENRGGRTLLSYRLHFLFR